MKNRMLPLFCAAALLASAALPLAARADEPTLSYVYTENGLALNMRKTPSITKNNLIGQIPFGAKVRVDSYANDKWASITYNNTTGYVSTRYLVDYKPVKEGTHLIAAAESGNE